ncbi:MAG TPA: patatin-like phospholipase family protein [Limnobacter sp.]|nr:patatin-like phospholipase family protein [Limnobacter sp.]
MTKNSESPRIGLALAGGGPLGAIYEIGALCALAESIDGLDLNDMHVYVGVSAGGIVATGLAHDLTPTQIYRLFIEGEPEEFAFDPSVLLRPAWREYWTRARKVPSLLSTAISDYFLRDDATWVSCIERLGAAIPTGLFNGDELHEWMADLIAKGGGTNDFRSLTKRLVLVATDLDSGESVPFGMPGHDDVPISKAVQASASLPGLFPPTKIGSRYYVDGALKKTLHASTALKDGAELLICLNPLVPYDDRLNPKNHRRRAKGKAFQPGSRLYEGGLPVVLSQTFRSIIHSRMDIGMERYAHLYPDADIVLFEPQHGDGEFFFTNPFSYASRRRLCEHAYQRTREELWARRHDLCERLGRHGLTLNLELLKDPTLRLGQQPKKRPARAGSIVSKFDQLEDSLNELDRYVRIAKTRQAA